MLQSIGKFLLQHIPRLCPNESSKPDSFTFMQTSNTKSLTLKAPQRLSHVKSMGAYEGYTPRKRNTSPSNVDPLFHIASFGKIFHEETMILRLQSQLKTALKAAEDARVSLHAERARSISEGEMKSLQLQLEKRVYEDKLKRMEIETEDSKKQIELQRIEINKRDKMCEEILKAKESEIENQHETILHLEQELANTRLELKEKDTNLDNILKTEEKLEAKEFEIVNKHEIILRLEQELANSRTELMEKDRNLDNILKTEVSRNSEMKNLEDIVSELKDKLKRMEIETEDSKKQIELQRIEINKRDKMCEEILKAKESEIENQHETILHLEQELANTRLELKEKDTYLDNILKTEEKLKAKEFEIENQHEIILRLEQELANSRIELMEKDRNLDNILKTEVSRNSEMKNLEDIVSELKDKLKRMEIETEDSKKQIELQRIEINKRDKMCEEILKAKESEIENQHETILHLEQELANTRLELKEKDTYLDNILKTEEKLKAKEFEIENQHEIILRLEQELANSRIELMEKDRNLDNILKTEVSRNSEMKNLEDIVSELKEKSDTLLKAKYKLIQVNQALAKELDELKLDKEVHNGSGDITAEVVMKEKDNQMQEQLRRKDIDMKNLEQQLAVSRLELKRESKTLAKLKGEMIVVNQALGKELDELKHCIERQGEELKKEKDDNRKEKERRQKWENKLLYYTKNVEKWETKISSDLDRHKHAVNRISDELGKLKRYKGNFFEGTPVVQVFDDHGSYISAVKSFKRVVSSIFSELGTNAGQAVMPKASLGSVAGETRASTSLAAEPDVPKDRANAGQAVMPKASLGSVAGETRASTSLAAEPDVPKDRGEEIAREFLEKEFDLDEMWEEMGENERIDFEKWAEAEERKRQENKGSERSEEREAKPVVRENRNPAVGDRSEVRRKGPPPPRNDDGGVRVREDNYGGYRGGNQKEIEGQGRIFRTLARPVVRENRNPDVGDRSELRRQGAPRNDDGGVKVREDNYGGYRGGGYRGGNYYGGGGQVNWRRGGGGGYG